MSDTKDTPEWMTDEWLHSAKLLTDSPTWEWSKVAGAAREILRLRAELACKGCGGTVGHHLAPDQGGCPGRFVIDGVPMVPAAHVEAARAEVERYRGICEQQLERIRSLNVEIGHTMQASARLMRERDAAIRDRNAAQEGEFNARRAMHDAEVDRNELAAGELEALDRLYKLPENVGNTLRARIVKLRQDSAAELRKAAGAAAPAGPSINALIQGAEDAAVEWGKCVGDYHVACRAAPPSPRDVSDAVNESGHKCELAWGVLRKAIRAIAAPICTSSPVDLHQSPADLHQSTPAADARQPIYTDDQLREIASDPLIADGPIYRNPVSLAAELLATRARLAASEKAKAELVEIANVVAASLADVAGKVYPLTLRRYREAAERAGGAS